MRDKFPWLETRFIHQEIHNSGDFSLLIWLRWVGVLLVVGGAMKLLSWLV